MPIYEYKCKHCFARFDVEQSFSDDALTVCPTTGGPAQCTAPGEGEVKKVFGSIGISFKGSGFYKNDSRKVASANGSDAAKKTPEPSTASADGSGNTASSSDGKSGGSPATSTPSATSSGDGGSKASTSPSSSD